MPENVEIVNYPDNRLSDEEKDLCKSIGTENPDYCAAAVLTERYPNREIEYDEEGSAFIVDGERMELDFDLIGDAAQIVVDDRKELEGDFDWISEIIVTVELLFGLIE
jgi:hypothetical protein